MMGLADKQLAIVTLLAGLWLAGAFWAVLRGLGMQSRARFAETQLSHVMRLVDCAPALPMLIKPDQRIEAPERLAQWLGFDAMPRSFDGLVGSDALRPAERDILRHHVIAAQRGGPAFALTLHPAGGSRTLLVRGAPANPELGSVGSVILWTFDATEAQGEIAQLRRDRDDAVGAFSALSGVIDAAPLPMWFRGPDLRLELVNQAYVDAAGTVSAVETLRAGIELVEPVAGQSARDAAQVASDRGEISSRAIPVTAHGERRMMRVVDVPLGETGVAGYAIDIQDLENARGEYRRFVDAQRAMMDRMSAAVAQFGPDRQLRFTNQPFRHMFSLDAAWLSENPEFSRLLDRMRETGRTPEVRDYPAWRDERRSWFSSTETSEETWLLRDGTHLRSIAQPTPDGGLLLFVEDRTEQVQLEGARDTLLRVRTATFDNLAEAIGVFQSDGRLHLWNRRFRELWALTDEALSQHPRVDELMRHIAPMLERPERARVLQELVRAATLDRRQRKSSARFSDGRQFEIGAIPLPDGNALLTMLDVTDSRRIETALRDRNEALEAADRIRADFLAKMSYELRTPLTSIAGFAEMLLGGYSGDLPAAANDYVKAILASSQALSGQIDTVLDLAQSEVGMLPLVKTELDLAELVTASVAAVRESISGGAEIALHLDPGLGIIQGDAKRLRQALDHLIANALRYTQAVRGDTSRILIHGDGDAMQARIIISDNGPGIDPERLARLLDQRRASRASTLPEKESKHGLGLPLTQELVKAHGGTVELVSEAGVGTMATISLPRQ